MFSFSKHQETFGVKPPESIEMKWYLFNFRGIPTIKYLKNKHEIRFQKFIAKQCKEFSDLEKTQFLHYLGFNTETTEQKNNLTYLSWGLKYGLNNSTEIETRNKLTIKKTQLINHTIPDIFEIAKCILTGNSERLNFFNDRYLVTLQYQTRVNSELMLKLKTCTKAINELVDKAKKDPEEYASAIEFLSDKKSKNLKLTAAKTSKEELAKNLTACEEALKNTNNLLRATITHQLKQKSEQKEALLV
jgi:hypothetical protein